MDKYNFFKRQGAVRPTAEQLLDTKLFYQNSVDIYAHYGLWKDDDRFYFIPLYMQMTYSCAGWVAEIAPDPVWLGSFIRCTLEHPELFLYPCPECSNMVNPYRYVGSPLSGVVHLEGRCKCGWHGINEVTGWRIRATALRDQVANDTGRYRKFKLLHPRSHASTIAELIKLLNL